ncbi:hypothetical protein COHA_007742 [Chlorella ohadii]|uniref:Plant heme peroxidase family profile domain-containing protein n=1 Tax=Chlorella ohadii TaxID=2649997 RepID=A0AAD5DL81_9CHLO|nr:hypothetical protein COHA_007742 [Chlorella ohadii]
MHARASQLLALGLLALLAAGVSGALPGPFANEGGPSFINGATFLLDEAGGIVAVALVADDGYVAGIQSNGTLLAERGVYTSWECAADMPGYYRSLVQVTVTDPTGAVVDERTVCELGTMTDSENRWAQSETGCPTVTNRINRFFIPPAAIVGTHACPFASMMQGGDLDAPGRKLLQATCNIAALDQANRAAVPAGPSAQTAVDVAVRNIAKQIILFSTNRNAPGVGGPGTPNRAIRHGALLRQAFHDCGTYNKPARTGGCNGSLRTQSEVGAGVNANLVGTVALVQRYRQLINAEINRQIAAGKLPAGTAISYADTFQLTGAAAVVATGGPANLIDRVEMGRVDWATRSDDVSLLPARNQGFGTLACRFLAMGFTLRDLVALSAAHTLGAVNGRAMTPTPQTFDGSDYFQLVSRGTAAFRTDNALTDARTAQLVQRWSSSANRAELFSAFADSYIKMGRMNAFWRSYPQPAQYVRA